MEQYFGFWFPDDEEDSNDIDYNHKKRKEVEDGSEQ